MNKFRQFLLLYLGILWVVSGIYIIFHPTSTLWASLFFTSCLCLIIFNAKILMDDE